MSVKLLEMTNKAKVIVVASTVVVLLSGIAIVRFGGRKPRPRPVPVSQKHTEVAVVPVGEHGSGRTFDAPPSVVMSAVKVVCGLDAKTAGRYSSRISALHSISKHRNLPPEDVLALCEFVTATNDAISVDCLAGLKNEVLNLLRNQVPVPELLPELMIDMIGCGEYDATTVDYCIQHLGSMWQGFSSEGLRENVRKVLVDAASRRRLPYAGTALYALADEAGAPTEYRVKLRQLTVSLAIDFSSNPLARISAIQLAAQKGYDEVLPVVRRMISDKRVDMVLTMVCVGAIGYLGNASDIPLLEDLRERGSVRLHAAVDAALARIHGGKILNGENKVVSK